MSKMLPKILAMYLPQFHETIHNNEWWGKGFTEWTALKQSKRYFENHQAPWYPLNDNYYDLSKVETMRWQADLAKKYGIDGFCFYHYYFENGQLELEKPAENLLNHPEIDMPFCFNWANESWVSSWSNIPGNHWSTVSSSSCNSKSILAKQNYGTKTEWKAHFDYLLPFFKDKRYIRYLDKPVFIIYKPLDIPNLNYMIKFWQELAIDNGLEGLYIIGEDVSAVGLDFDASLIHEPTTSMVDLYNQGKVEIHNGTVCYDTSDIWKNSLNKQGFLGAKTYFMAFTGFDDTPRRGNKGKVLINNNEQEFFTGLVQSMIKSIQCENHFLFINAWNEWGEGMYLEPDKRNKYAYLEQINRAKKYIQNRRNFNKGIENKKIMEENSEIYNLQQNNIKYKQYMEWLNRWLSIQRKQRFCLKKFMKENNLSSLAIYGLAMLGHQLYMQCLEERIPISFGIDRHIIELGSLCIKRPEENISNVDAIIITNYEYEQVKDFLKTKTTAKLYTVEDLLTYFENCEECDEA